MSDRLAIDETLWNPEAIGTTNGMLYLAHHAASLNIGTFGGFTVVPSLLISPKPLSLSDDRGYRTFISEIFSDKYILTGPQVFTSNLIAVGNRVATNFAFPEGIVSVSVPLWIPTQLLQRNELFYLKQLLGSITQIDASQTTGKKRRDSLPANIRAVLDASESLREMRFGVLDPQRTKVVFDNRQAVFPFMGPDIVRLYTQTERVEKRVSTVATIVPDEEARERGLTIAGTHESIVMIAALNKWLAQTFKKKDLSDLSIRSIITVDFGVMDKVDIFHPTTLKPIADRRAFYTVRVMFNRNK